MNLLFTLNKKYIPQLIILLKSIIKSNPDTKFNVYIISKDLNELDLSKINENFQNENLVFSLIKFDDTELITSPTSRRYPLEIYYRLFASKVLPNNIDRILYLDPDIVVINKLDELYNMDFEDNYFIGATHVRGFLRKLNEIRVRAPKDAHYINTGVMLMNIERLRLEQKIEEVYEYIEKNKNNFTLPDQDILCGLYGDRVKLINQYIYNLSDRMIVIKNITSKDKIDLNWVKYNTVIIHYCGRNKPWNKKYRGILDCFYNEHLLELIEA